MLKLVPFCILLTLFAGCFYPSSRPAQPVAGGQQQPVSGVQTPLEADALELPGPDFAVENALLEPGLDQAAVPEVWDATLIGEPEESGLEKNRPLPYFGDFPLADHERVALLVKRYTGPGKKTFALWLERAGRYVPEIQEIFAEEGVPLDLAYLAMIESGFNSKAYSWAHAAGPWQFIESTGNIYGLTNDWWQDQRCHVEKSTRAAAQHLKYLNKRFDGDWYLAVAAYNAGGGKVRKAIKAKKSRNFWDLAEDKVLSEETRNYLPKLIASLEIVRDLEGYGFNDLDFEVPVEAETVTVPTTTDLEVVASLCAVEYADIKALNPELKRWSTPPGVQDYQLQVPAGTAALFAAGYAELPEDQRARYHRHQICRGDTLRALAKQYRIQVDDIVLLNNIKNPRALKVGSNLILPLKEGFTRLPVDELADSYVRSRRRTYKVRNGDSLWTIARRNNVTEKQLRVWNKLGWKNLIRPGQMLMVSKPGKRQIAKASNKGPGQKVVYQVKPGDTLWEIGRSFDVATNEIRSWNALSPRQILRPGQKLVLMVTNPGKQQVAKAKNKGPAQKVVYQVRPGDTLWEIGRRFDVATEEIRGWNELSPKQILRPGQKLTLMVASSHQG